MKSFVIIALCFLLAGCGVMGGGSTYKVEVVDPSGRILRASADTVQASESVELEFKGNPLTGDIQGLSFKKQGAQLGGWNNSVLEKALDRIPRQ